jgi:hypothetical protein
MKKQVPDLVFLSAHGVCPAPYPSVYIAEAFAKRQLLCKKSYIYQGAHQGAFGIKPIVKVWDRTIFIKITF